MDSFCFKLGAFSCAAAAEPASPKVPTGEWGGGAQAHAPASPPALSPEVGVAPAEPELGPPALALPGEGKDAPPTLVLTLPPADAWLPGPPAPWNRTDGDRCPSIAAAPGAGEIGLASLAAGTARAGEKDFKVWPPFSAAPCAEGGAERAEGKGGGEGPRTAPPLRGGEEPRAGEGLLSVEGNEKKSASWRSVFSLL